MCKLCSRFRNSWNDDERLDGIDFSCIKDNDVAADQGTKKVKMSQDVAVDKIITMAASESPLTTDKNTAPLSLSDRIAAEKCQVLQKQRLPCVILTGFLGSGKTTLLNQILRNSSLKLAVIENEVGEQSVDEKLLQTKGDKSSLDTKTEVVLMPNGCLCCRVRGDLVNALKDISSRKESSQLEGIILEMSGLSSLAPVVQTFFADDFVQAHICLDNVICIVDSIQAPRILNTPNAKEGLLIREQLSLADIVLVNKIDSLHNAAETEVLSSAICRINSMCDIIKCSLHEDNPDVVKELNHRIYTKYSCFSLENALKTSDTLQANLSNDTTVAASAQDHVQHDHDILGFTSLSIVISDGSIDYLKLKRLLEESIVKVYPDSLVRYKGTIWSKVDTKDVQMIMQGVFGHVEFSWNKQIVHDSDRMSTLVFIGSIDQPVYGKDGSNGTLGQLLREMIENCKVPNP